MLEKDRGMALGIMKESREGLRFLEEEQDSGKMAGGKVWQDENR